MRHGKRLPQVQRAALAARMLRERRDAIWPWILLTSVCSLVAATAHLYMFPQHVEEWWGYGAFFLLVAIGQACYAALTFLRPTSDRLATIGIVGTVGILTLYVTTRTVGIPWPGPHAGEVEAFALFDLATAAVEVAMVLCLLTAKRWWHDAANFLLSGLVVGVGTSVLLAGAAAWTGATAEILRSALAPERLGIASLTATLTFTVGRFVAQWVVTAAGLRRQRHTAVFVSALVIASLYVLFEQALVATAVLQPGHAHHLPGGRGADLAVTTSVTAGAALVVILAVLLPSRHRPWEPTMADVFVRAVRRSKGRHVLRSILLLSLFASATSMSTWLLPTPQVMAAPTDQPCTVASSARSYDVVALNVTIPYNRWGERDEAGEMYALRGDVEAVRGWSRPLAANPADDSAKNRRLRPRPLVLRANANDCVAVTLTNELNVSQWGGTLRNPRVSIHVHGPAYAAFTSDGSSVGYNDDTTLGRGERMTYLWRAPADEGLYFFHDHAQPSGDEGDGGGTVHGLFGALAVEPAGSRWTDPESGAALYTETGAQSGDLYINADIHPPNAPSFRESVQLGQDEIPHGIGFGFNYGAENARNREANRCPDCIGEETSLSSWAYGDPALVKLASGLGPWLPSTGDPENCGLASSCYVANVVHTYRGDPVKIRYGMAGVKETHVFHLHAHQWRAEPTDPKSTAIDSQTMGPGDMFTADLLFGAGSKPGTVGDSIFHCHLYSHFAEGFWALLRVHDVQEDGTGVTPDRVRVRSLRTLPALAALPAPTAENPGFPRFIPGTYGWRAPQPPGSITEVDPATGAVRDAVRTVAGRPLETAKVAVERRVQERNYGGRAPKPGAPLTDPCPTGAREITYNTSVIQRDIVYNEAGWHDTQGRLVVLDQDVDAVLKGTKAPEPMFIRANAGDCINFNLTVRTPNWLGGDAFLKLQQTNMMGEHIHLVKFDVLGSDGSSNGWNYQGAAFTEEQARFNADVLAGRATCSADESVGACRLPLPAQWNPSWTGNPRGQTIHERWYADSELRTVFTHDHHFAAVAQGRGFFGALIVEPAGMDMRNPRTGAYKQPINDPAHGTPCGARCEATAIGPEMDLIGPGARDDFREFGLAFQDFVPLTKRGGDPTRREDVLNPPPAPEALPLADPGVMGINYRNAPLSLREKKNGVAIDPAYRFSSWVFGDPATPLLEAYGGDAIRIRLIQGSQEEGHVFAMHGMRWRKEPDDPTSPLVSSQPIGISEAFNIELPQRDCSGLSALDCVGDYMYGSPVLDDTYLGVWGIMRVRFDRVPTLLPLPDNTKKDLFPTVKLRPTGAPPPRVPPGLTQLARPCPSSAPTRTYEVVALETSIKYNRYGDHDPYGLMYSLVEPGETVDQAVARARGRPEPFVMRANAGDCLVVGLTNRVTKGFLAHQGAADGDAAIPIEPTTGTPAGLRVSLHPQLVKYDVVTSDGATVGYNFDETVGPGERTVYIWYADEVQPGELGAANLLDFGDVRGHRHHGLSGALIIEPRGAQYVHPVTGKPVYQGAVADIRLPGAGSFREYTVVFQDGLNLRNAAGVPLPDPVSHPPAPGVAAEPMDYEDRGEKAINYSNAPFARRLGFDPNLASQAQPVDGDALAAVFNSRRYGEPDTPIFRAYAGDPVRLRVVQGSDKPRAHAFQLSGHSWRTAPGETGALLVGAQGGMSVGHALNVEAGPAGSTANYPGDYRYGCMVAFHHQSSGLWGLMRVYPRPAQEVLVAEPVRQVDDPHQAGYAPVLSLRPVQVATPAPATSAPATPPPAAQTVTGTPVKVTVSKGVNVSGRASNLAKIDKSYVTVRSTGSWFAHGLDSEVAVTLPPSSVGAPGTLTVAYAGGASWAVPLRSVSIYNVKLGVWQSLTSALQPLSDTTAVLAVPGDASSFVSRSGEVRLRVIAVSLVSFQLNLDQLTVSLQP